MEKVYLQNSYLSQLPTSVTKQGQDEKGPYVCLAASIIYPGGGGQPADQGWINDRLVTEIIESAEETRFYFAGKEKLPTEVVVKIDWARRFELMQQHTGQHILARACENRLSAVIRKEQITLTDSFFEIAEQKLTAAELAPVIDVANEIIRQHRPVTIHFPAADEITNFPNWQQPRYFPGLRLIDIAEFDTIGCGGTHVANTSEVQLLTLDTVKNHKKGTTLHFSCGQRVAKNYQRHQNYLQELTALTQEPVDELTAFVSQQTDKLHELQQRLAEISLQSMIAEAEVTDQTVLAFGQKLGVKELKAAAQQLRQKYPNQLIATFTTDAENFRYHLETGTENSPNIRQMIQEFNQLFGGRGGGSPVMGDGTVPIDKKTELLAQLKDLI